MGDGQPDVQNGAETRSERPTDRDPLREVDIIGARLEGTQVTLRDVARLALCAALIAAIAILVAIYLLQIVRHGAAASP